MFSHELLYSCGKESMGLHAIEVIGTRWTWFDHCMADLSAGVALYVKNAADVKITAGYYSSNQSALSPCLLVLGASPNFLATGTCFSDSRNFGAAVAKDGGLYPLNCRFIGVTFQNNDINPAQLGDILLNSVLGVTLTNCNLASNKPGGVALIDTLGGGSSMLADGCSFAGGVNRQPNTTFKNINSFTHPEEQRGIASIPAGVNYVDVPLRIAPLISGATISVVATPASGSDVLSAGVVGSVIRISRATSASANTVSFIAFAVY